MRDWVLRGWSCYRSSPETGASKNCLKAVDRDGCNYNINWRQPAVFFLRTLLYQLINNRLFPLLTNCSRQVFATHSNVVLLPRDPIRYKNSARYYSHIIVQCLSETLQSTCVSHSCIVSKLLKRSSNFFLGMVTVIVILYPETPPLQNSEGKTPRTGAWSGGGLGKIRSFRIRLYSGNGKDRVFVIVKRYITFFNLPRPATAAATATA